MSRKIGPDFPRTLANVGSATGRLRRALRPRPINGRHRRGHGGGPHSAIPLTALAPQGVVHRHRGESSEANLLAANFDARASGRVLQHRPENLRHLTRRNLAALAAECGEAEAEKLWHEALLECPGDKLARARVGSANQVRLEPEMDAARAHQVGRTTNPSYMGRTAGQPVVQASTRPAGGARARAKT
jgi:hypothetical protein